MTTTATRSGSLPNHVDDNGKSRYAVHTDQQGRITLFSDYAPAAWFQDEPKAALWSAQQLCVHVMDNELGTCPYRDRLNVFYTDLMFALRGNSRIDTNSFIGRYNAFVTEYNSTIQPAAANDRQVAPVTAVPVATSQPAPAHQPTRVVERDVVTSPAPNPAPVAEPVVSPAPVREPASQPTRATSGRTAARFASPVSPSGEPTNADLMAVLQGVRPVLDDHAEMLDDHERQINEIIAVLPTHNGRLVRYTEWSNHTVSVAGRNVRWAPAIAAFLITLLLLVLFWTPNAFEAGFWFSLSQGWKWFWTAVISIFVLVLTNLRLFTKTASAA